MFRSPGRILYHVTPASNLDAIKRDGLRPALGDRSGKIEKDAATYLFHDILDLQDALLNWLGDEFDANERLVVLQAVLPSDWTYAPSEAGYEAATTTPIPGELLHVALYDADDLDLPGDGRGEALIEATAENVETARSFLMERWIERSLERFPNRPVPTDLSDACKFGSAFSQKLFGGDLVVNEDHQFVVLPGGWILDLGQDAADVAAMEAPYLSDLEMLDELEWQDSMRSIQPRVSEWVSDFVTSLSRDMAR